MADRREGLLALAVQSGLGVMQALFNQDVDRLCGLSGKDNSDRQGYLNGRTDGIVGLGGRRIPITRARVRSADGSGELPGNSKWTATRNCGAPTSWGRMALERMIAGLSTRNDRSGLEPVGAEVEERCVGTGKSSVCCRFIAPTATALAELLARPLNEVDLVAGGPGRADGGGVHCGEQTCLVALAIDITGVKHRLAIVEGATENATVVRELLAGLCERGLDVTGPILVVIDGAKELRSAVDDVFDQPIIERCQEHKIRNVRDRLPQQLRNVTERRMRAAYHAESTIAAEAALEALGTELAKTDPGAAASLREGLEETFTVTALAIPPTLAPTLHSANPIESMISICRDSTGNVKRWRNGQMALRCCAAGMLKAEKQFRRVNGHLHLAALRQALHLKTEGRHTSTIAA